MEPAENRGLEGSRGGETSPAVHGDSGRAASASRIARNTILQAVGAAVSYLATLAFFVVLARELGDVGFGDFTFALSIGVLVSVSALGTDYAITREVARDRERLHQVFWNSVAIRLCFGALGIAVAVGATWLAGYNAEIVAATAILSAATGIAVLAQATQAALRGYEDMAPIGAAWAIQRFFTAVVGGAVVLVGGGLIAAAWVYFVGAMIGLVYSSAVLLHRHVRPRLAISWQRSRALIGTSIPLAVGNVMVLVLGRLDVVILSALNGNAAVGIYGAAYRLFEGTAFFSTLFGLSAYPALSRLGRDTRPTIGEAYEKGCKALGVILVPVGVGLILFAEPIVSLLYGSEYSDSVTVLRLLGGATPLWGLLTFTMFVLAAVGQQKVIGWVLAVGVAVNVALNLALIPPYSVDGAAAAMTISLAVIDVALIVLAVRATGRLRLIRVCAGPTAGAIAMTAIGIGWGTDLVEMPPALLAYALTTLAVEKRFFDGDLAFMLRAIRGGFGRRSRSEVMPATGAGSADSP